MPDMIVSAEEAAINAYLPLVAVTLADNPEFNLRAFSGLVPFFLAALFAPEATFAGHYFTSTPIPAEISAAAHSSRMLPAPAAKP